MLDDRDRGLVRRTRWTAVAAIAALLATFAALSFSAVLTKSATYDEPLNALAAWIHRHYGDFRVNFEQPVLPQYWAALANSERSIRIDLQDPNWLWMPQNSFAGWEFAADTLYRTPGNDGAAFVNRSRFMMMLLGVALGVVICFWAWKLAGPVAAVMAAAMFSLSPNMLAHAALVKNDVPLALMSAAVFLVVWKVGRTATVGGVLGLCLLVAASLNTKFSALLFGPMIGLLLLVRVLDGAPWPLERGVARSVGSRAAVAGAIALAVLAVSFLGIWGCYGFRFGPSDDPSIALNTQIVRSERAYALYQVRHPAPRAEPFDPSLPVDAQRSILDRRMRALEQAATEARATVSLPRIAISHSELEDLVERARVLQADVAALGGQSPASAPADAGYPTERMHLAGLSASVLEYQLKYAVDRARLTGTPPDRLFAVGKFLLDHRVLPSPWVHGLLLVEARSIVRDGYLLGEIRNTGWWYYFPLAVLFKTPVAMLLTAALAIILGIRLLARSGRGWFAHRWSIACLGVPLVVYVAASLLSNLNIGLRHLLAVYPFVYVGAAVVIARAISRWPRPVLVAVSALGVLYSVEAGVAWPDYIAYFNIPSGGSRGGIRLLGDSNLDWGQDLPALKRWQERNPGKTLALAYFGMAAPEFYGIQADPLPPFPPPPDLLRTHVLAISATHLQGIFDARYTGYQQLTPTEVLGGTIYLYDDRPAGR